MMMMMMRTSNHLIALLNFAGLPGLPTHPQRRDMAEQQSQQHRLLEVPPMATHRHQSGNHGGLPLRNSRSLLPEHLPDVPLPVGHVHHHCGAHRLRDLCLRRHQQRERPAGAGQALPGVPHLRDYSSSWLQEKVTSASYWAKISSCIRDPRACGKLRRTYSQVPKTAELFYMRELSPIESGCCKPPTECSYVYQNETFWTSGSGVVESDMDCSKWSNDQQTLSYKCDSCKAGVLGSLKKSWRKVSVINIVILIILVIVYAIACAAFRHKNRNDNDKGYGKTRMERSQPSRIHF